MARVKKVFWQAPIFSRMNDETIGTRIEQLVDEEQRLRTREEADNEDLDALEADRQRLRSVGLELDRCWDLLRQRRALRAAGGDPDDAQVRDEETVEHYLQ
jgi:uncharacterized protein DUF2630